jgi:hypothetical protein
MRASKSLTEVFEGVVHFGKNSATPLSFAVRPFSAEMFGAPRSRAVTIRRAAEGYKSVRRGGVGFA